jgi:sulfite exporter TauE/SafE
MTTPPSRVLITSGVLLGALTGAAAASVLYGVLDANGFGASMFHSRMIMLLVGVGTLPFFTLGGAVAGGMVIRRFAPRLLAHSGKSSSSPP